MKPEEIKERKELIDIFFATDDISREVLMGYCTEITDDEEFLISFLVEAFNFCACGHISMSINFIKDILNCYEDREEKDSSPYLNLNKLKEVCGNDNIVDFMLHWTDAVELTEHGTSVYGSWLIEKGKALRDYLRDYYEEEERN